ncbi:hypothetical protein DFJ74DRAFT_654602 [Hyaloraphidium curvatum]|nr:hypothetical protein DFJ74DRAFT_654602 [Hyaloraphidium curvatum]
MHSLRCVTDEVRWVDSDDYGSALQCARRITDLALAVELRWAGGGSGPGPQSAGWFPYLAPPANLVTGLYYTASIWLEELRQLVALARGDGRTGASLHYSTRDISNHSALRDLAMACIAAAEKGGEGDADDDAVSVSSKAADPLFPGLSFVPADPAPGSSAAPPAQVPEFVRCRARECVVRFQHHVALLRRIGNHLRTAAGCADALVTLWKADPSMKYVEEVLVR